MIIGETSAEMCAEPWTRMPSLGSHPVGMNSAVINPHAMNAAMFGITIPASFSSSRLSLVDRGFVFAIAHVCGGKDKGYRWYSEGKRDKKLNTFRDFVSVARHLIEVGITSAGRIVAA